MRRRARVSEVRLAVAVAAAAQALCALPGAARAYNVGVHQAMTDYAYEVMLAMSKEAAGGAALPNNVHVVLANLKAGDPTLAGFYAAAAIAVPKLRALESGLTATTLACQDAAAVAKIGAVVPDWQTGVLFLPQMPLGQLRFPVTADYNFTTDCGIAGDWTPSGQLALVNAGAPPDPFTSRDHTGVTLGYWAAYPDRQHLDWRLRSTVGEALQNPLTEGTIGGGTTIAVGAACFAACGIFPPACLACPVLAGAAGSEAVDAIDNMEFTDMQSAEDYAGFGHYVDLATLPADTPTFDSPPGKLFVVGGPHAVPDLVEWLAGALFDLLGVHVRPDSEAVTNYQQALGASGAVGTDAHVNTTLRPAGAFGDLTVPHTPMTAVDNLGLFGYRQFETHRNVGSFKDPTVTADTTQAAKRLGWPLHALGDASVPHHTVGASGYGHRPYEDALDFIFQDVVGGNDRAVSLSVISQVVTRAKVWRELIRTWRLANPGLGNEVPVRDLISALSAQTLGKAMANEAILFDWARSIQYHVAMDREGAMAAYQTATVIPIYRDLVIDGIAAELAFLLSATEVQ
jgi:hypothetical protein